MISIIVPCYNSAKFIDKFFVSISQQIYKDFEIIFINDGSRDNTLEHLKNIKENNADIKIKIVDKENGGVSSARNSGIREADGDYICFIDPDDTVEKEFLATLVSDIHENGIDCTSVGILRTTDARNNDSTKSTKTKDEFVYSILMDTNVYGYVCNKLFKKDIITKNNIFFKEDIHITEDLEFCLHYASYIQSAYVNNRQLYNYYNNENSALTSCWNEKKLSIIKTQNFVQDYNLSEENKKIARSHYTSTLLWILSHLYKTKDEAQISKYEATILAELRKNKMNFLLNGVRVSNIQYYISYILFLLHPKILKFAIMQFLK